MLEDDVVCVRALVLCCCWQGSRMEGNSSKEHQSYQSSWATLVAGVQNVIDKDKEQMEVLYMSKYGTIHVHKWTRWK